jgi:hypothetical protein
MVLSVVVRRRVGLFRHDMPEGARLVPCGLPSLAGGGSQRLARMEAGLGLEIFESRSPARGSSLNQRKGRKKPPPLTPVIVWVLSIIVHSALHRSRYHDGC